MLKGGERMSIWRISLETRFFAFENLAWVVFSSFTSGVHLELGFLGLS